MTLNELEIAISVEITKINAIDHEGSIASEMSALARVDALEWVLGLIKKPDRKDKDDEEKYKLRIHL